MTSAWQIQNPSFTPGAGEPAALQETVSTHKSHSCGTICCFLWEAHAHLLAAESGKVRDSQTDQPAESRLMVSQPGWMGQAG